MEAACRAAAADDVFCTDDPEEGEMFIAARRLAFPAIEARGSLLLEDVGVPVPLLPELLEGITALAAELAVEVPVVAHAGDGNAHPIGFDLNKAKAFLAKSSVPHGFTFSVDVDSGDSPGATAMQIIAASLKKIGCCRLPRCVT